MPEAPAQVKNGSTWFDFQHPRLYGTYAAASSNADLQHTRCIPHACRQTRPLRCSASGVEEQQQLSGALSSNVGVALQSVASQLPIFPEQEHPDRLLTCLHPAGRAFATATFSCARLERGRSI